MYETPEGYLVCVGVSIARTGEMIYATGETPIPPGPDGIVKIQRAEQEVFRPETIASFQGKSFTIFHPAEFVDPKSWKDLTVGVIQNVRRGEGAQSSDLVADIMVTAASAIKMVKSGVREVSCGYEAEYIETGIGLGVQKNIIGNHVALVDQGRAGQSYAINDHKGKGSTMKFTDKLKAIFEKAQDEAAKVAADEFPPKKDDKAKDDMPSNAAAAAGGAGYDEMVKAVKDLSDKIDQMKPKDASAPVVEKPKDAETVPSESKPAEMKDEPPSMEERMKKMEDAMATLVASKSTDEAGEEGEEAEDAEEDKDKAKDADEEVSEDAAGCMVGDTASRIEILAPGLKPTGKDVKAQALKACYATKDGKSIIEKFTGGKEVDYSVIPQVDAVFVGASELLKTERAKALSGTRTFDFKASSLSTQGGPTPEEINKKMAEHYKK